MSEDNYNVINEYFELIKSDESQIANLYNEDFVNWSGPQIPTNVKPYYSDYIAQKLLGKNNFGDLFTELDGSDRSEYFVSGHDGVVDLFTNREEEIFAKLLLGHKIGHLGHIIDYQMPLKKERGDDYGKVDLISLNANNKNAYLIELKMNLTGRKEETVLRAALEIETYYHVLSKDRFEKYISDKIDERYTNKKHPLYGINTNDLTIRKAVLYAVHKESGLPQELREENAGYYQNLKKLLAEFGTNLYVIDYTYPVHRTAIA